jgi:hypothetical protein
MDSFFEENSMSPNRQFTFLRLLSMNSPEWIIVLIGCLACVVNGAAESIFAVLLAKIVNVTNVFYEYFTKIFFQTFKDCSYSERRRQVLICSFIFLALGFLVLVFRFLQVKILFLNLTNEFSIFHSSIRLLLHRGRN